jgi:FHS family L-fucose permease-like MFS transporter
MTSIAPAKPAEERSARFLLGFVYFIYFFCGLTQCFEGVFLPEFKSYFHLSYRAQMYIMCAKNVPFLLAVGIGFLLRRIGYRKALVAALLLFGAGTLLLVPGLRWHTYGLILTAFFIVGLGFNFQMVAGNPMISALGPARESASRLNLANALGAIAQIIAPATLSLLIPATLLTVEAKLPHIMTLFLALGASLLAAAVVFGTAANPAHFRAVRTDPAPAVSMRPLSLPQVRLGFIAIFLTLGAEAGLFGFFRNYLEDPSIAGLSASGSERLFTVYFAVFALGRLLASWAQKSISPALWLIVNTIAALICVVAIMASAGTVAVIAMTTMALFASVFFPTLFSLAIQDLGAATAPASGLLTMGFLGCAIIPLLQGSLADSAGLQRSYVITLICYAGAGLFALRQLLLRRQPA